LKFSPIASTKMACLSGDVQRVETSFLNLLQQTTRFEIEGNKLRLYAGSAGGASVLVFVDRAANSQTGANTGAIGRVTGTITYRQRIALTSRAVVYVKLVDTSRLGGPPLTIADETTKLAGRQAPIAFELTYDTWRIGPRGSYSVQVRIVDRGKVRFRSTDAYRVITGGHPNTVNVIVKPVSK
jgi:putative lipoprotein